MTDMEVSCKGNLLTDQGLPPRERMSLVPQYVDRQVDHLGHLLGAWLKECGHAGPWELSAPLDLLGRVPEEPGPDRLCPEAQPGAS